MSFSHDLRLEQSGGPGGVSALDQSPIGGIAGGKSTLANHSHFTEIQLELELLKERRRALERQRKLLLRGAGPDQLQQSMGDGRRPTSRNVSPVPNAIHTSSTRSSSARSNRSGSRSAGRSGSQPSAMDQKQFIPSERDRREHLAKNVYYEMKEAMRRSWQHDSTLVGGYFGLQDNVTSTFGRERRFTPLPGQKGSYHLATDTEEMQRAAHQLRQRHLTASSRGRPGCNVQSNWNDSRGGCAPGPGAYTPRFQKVAKPSILTSRCVN